MRATQALIGDAVTVPLLDGRRLRVSAQVVQGPRVLVLLSIPHL